MNCPVCGSEIPAGVKYCPVCGTDVEEAEIRTQQAVRVAPTQQMPMQQPVAGSPANPMAQQTQQRAVPMNSSMPPTHENTRNFDTSKMEGSPKWPLIVIAVLAVAVVVLVILLVVRGCDNAPAPTVQTNEPAANTPVTPVDTDPGTTPVVGGDQASDPAATTPGTLDNAAAYEQLSAAYDQLGAFADRIQGVVDYCNNRDENDSAGLQAEIDSARALQAEIAAQGDSLNAIQLAADSPYVTTLANLKTLNTDLAGRIGDLVDGMQQWANGQDADAFARHNENGQSTYKTEYEALYPNARPVQQ